MVLATLQKPASLTKPAMTRASTMKALVYQAVGKKALVDRPKPKITAPTDAIVKIMKTTICGTDLHILKGDLPSCQPGRILGHEGVGIVDQVGSAVTVFKPGDHVLISCVSSCGKCVYCRKQMYSHLPQALTQEISTRSPALNAVTAGPTLSMTPTPS